ncbi:MAG TPA: hypothetical protein EYP39_04295 [Ghiorsea sp.]|nr:hypothetical protein [Ghiorsea sp.]
MKVITSIAELQHALGSFDKEQIALVPTMGCLHEGHVSLMRKAKRLADIVVVSIYVNPLQFGENEDLDTYPRPFDDDVLLCQDEGVDFIFHPENLYPHGAPQVTLHVDDLNTLVDDSSIAETQTVQESKTDEYNYALGLKRAKSVKKDLIKNGIASERIVVVSYVST